MSAICFGYGLFHLCVSLLPNSLLRLIQLLGFAGDRTTGLEALMFARQGPDMRAPLATLALLWYHTIVRPFYAVDGHNVNAGVEAASRLIEESQPDYADSALFLFFKGKIHRLKNDIDGAVSVYSSAVERSPQREMQLLCLHEVAWCRLIQLDYPLAYSAFLQLKHSAQWGKPFYAYLTAVCAGAIGDTNVVVRLTPKLMGVLKSEEALHRLISHRAAVLGQQPPHYFRLLAYELLYLWNDLHATKQMNSIIEDCDTSSDIEEPMVGLRNLIKGVCWRLIGDMEAAVRCLQESLAQRALLSPNARDSHVSAFAHYELGTIFLAQPERVEEGKRLLYHAQSAYKDYDFENRLNIRIHTALRRANNNV
ncbi:hypothetical protein AAG570_005701 [Ranatra chinensis]|uniref:Tetratricopeptide repeat protein 39C n=1 Tax=Ranatra chinensis TaxID=642074 RepID=A0ABD0XYB1_9HEMI